MDRLNRHIKYLLLLLGVAIVSTSCMGVLDLNDDICSYNVQLMYRYNRENTSSTNQLPRFIKSLEEYIFDNDGVLYAINHLTLDVCTGQWVSELTLPPGKYTAIAWGNMDARSRASVSDAVVGKTSKHDMMLYLDNPYTRGVTDFEAASERLYYGYRTFSVKEYGASFITVDMSHAHCVLNVTVRWKRSEDIPKDTYEFYFLMKQIPSQYDFMPGYYFPNKVAAKHDVSKDEYPYKTSGVLHHIPSIYKDDYLKTYCQDTRLLGKEIRQEIITYRHCNDSHQLLSLYSKAGAGGQDAQVMKEIDLNQFFQKMGIELDTNLRQEFELLLEIDGSTIFITMTTDVADWEEGGFLGRSSTQQWTIAI